MAAIRNAKATKMVTALKTNLAADAKKKQKKQKVAIIVKTRQRKQVHAQTAKTKMERKKKVAAANVLKNAMPTNKSN